MEAKDKGSRLTKLMSLGRKPSGGPPTADPLTPPASASQATFPHRVQFAVPPRERTASDGVWRPWPLYPPRPPTQRREVNVSEALAQPRAYAKLFMKKRSPGNQGKENQDKDAEIAQLLDDLATAEENQESSAQEIARLRLLCADQIKENNRLVFMMHTRNQQDENMIQLQSLALTQLCQETPRNEAAYYNLRTQRSREALSIRSALGVEGATSRPATSFPSGRIPSAPLPSRPRLPSATRGGPSAERMRALSSASQHRPSITQAPRVGHGEDTASPQDLLASQSLYGHGGPPSAVASSVALPLASEIKRRSSKREPNGREAKLREPTIREPMLREPKFSNQPTSEVLEAVSEALQPPPGHARTKGALVSPVDSTFSAVSTQAHKTAGPTPTTAQFPHLAGETGAGSSLRSARSLRRAEPRPSTPAASVTSSTRRITTPPNALAFAPMHPGDFQDSAKHRQRRDSDPGKVDFEHLRRFSKYLQEREEEQESTTAQLGPIEDEFAPAPVPPNEYYARRLDRMINTPTEQQELPQWKEQQPEREELAKRQARRQSQIYARVSAARSYTDLGQAYEADSEVPHASTRKKGKPSRGEDGKRRHREEGKTRHHKDGKTRERRAAGDGSRDTAKIQMGDAQRPDAQGTPQATAAAAAEDGPFVPLEPSEEWVAKCAKIVDDGYVPMQVEGFVNLTPDYRPPRPPTPPPPVPQVRKPWLGGLLSSSKRKHEYKMWLAQQSSKR